MLAQRWLMSDNDVVTTMVTKRDGTDTEAGGAASEPWRKDWQDYYAILGVGSGASAEEVRRAYDERAFILDPARFEDAPPNVLVRAGREFALLNQAFTVLSDPGLRQLYDDELSRLTSFRAGQGAPAATAEAAPQVASMQTVERVAAPPAVAVGEEPARSEEPPTSGVEPTPWGLPAILLVLLIPTLFWVSGFFVDVPAEQTTADVAVGLVTTIVFKDFLLIGLAAAFALWRYRLSWRALGFRPFDKRRWWLPLAAVGATYVGLIVYGLILVALGANDPEQEAVQSFFDSKALLPLTFVALVIMAPLSEETFFRGFIFGGLIRPLGPIPAMIASGLLFGAFHVSGMDTLALVVPIGAIGAIFAWIYMKTGSLWLSIASHSLFNCLSFLAMALAR